MIGHSVQGLLKNSLTYISKKEVKYEIIMENRWELGFDKGWMTKRVERIGQSPHSVIAVRRVML